MQVLKAFVVLYDSLYYSRLDLGPPLVLNMTSEVGLDLDSQEDLSFLKLDANVTLALTAVLALSNLPRETLRPPDKSVVSLLEMS